MECRFDSCSTAVPLGGTQSRLRMDLQSPGCCAIVMVIRAHLGVGSVRFVGLVSKSRWPATTSDHPDGRAEQQLFATATEPLDALCIMGGLKRKGASKLDLDLTEYLRENTLSSY